MSVLDSLTSFKKLRKISLEQRRFNEVLSQESRIISVREEGGTQFAVLNTPYIMKITEKIDAFSKFWLKFETLQALHEEICIKNTYFLADYDQLVKFYDNVRTYLEPLREQCKNQYESYKIQLAEFELKERGDLVKFKEADELLVKDLLNLRNKNRYLPRLKETKHTMYLLGEGKGKLEQMCYSARDKLEYLNYFYQILVNNEIDKVKTSFDEYVLSLETVDGYIKHVKSLKEGLLFGEQDIDHESLRRQTAFIAEAFQKFKEIYFDLKILIITAGVKHECIEISDEMWMRYLQTAGFVRAKSYYIAERNYYYSKKDKAEFLRDEHYSRDHEKHMKGMLRSTLENVNTMNNDIANINLHGNVDCESRAQRFSFTTHDDRGNAHHHERTHYYLTRVSHDLNLYHYLSDREYIKPADVEKSEETMEYMNLAVTAINTFNIVNDEFNRLEAIEKDHKSYVEKLKQKTDSNVILIEEASNNLTNIIITITNFTSSLSNDKLEIEETFYCCLISLFLKNSTISVCPGCCEIADGKSELLADEISATYLYKVFYKYLKANGKQMKSYCIEDIAKIHFAKKIDFIDLKDVLFDIRILGALKTSDGKFQRTAEGFRDEDLSRSFYRILKNFAKLRCMHLRFYYSISKEIGEKYIRKLENSGETLLKESKYKSLAEKFRSYKFNKNS